jgi:hypothetical protein
MTKDRIKAWLLEYAWLGTKEEQAREVDCIMSQDSWRYLEARKEQLRAQASGEEDCLEDVVNEFALSGLYECHDEPHLTTCPRASDDD